MKKSTKKYWYEGKDHIEGKNILRAVGKRYGYDSREEEPVPIDLHNLEPELYPKRHIKPYQSDTCFFKGRKDPFRRLGEVDGEYHDPKEDAIRDARIMKTYPDVKVIARFEKSKLLKGEYSEEQIASMLGLA